MTTNPNEYMTFNRKKIIICEKDEQTASRARNLATKSATGVDQCNNTLSSASHVRSATGDQSARVLRHISRSPDRGSKNVVFDPLPQSHTILVKSAGTSSRRVANKIHRRVSPPRISLSNRNRDAVTGKDRSLERCADTAATTRRVYRTLPEECTAAYQRFTYLPAVKLIPDDTPSWKVPILQKRNKEVIDDFLERMKLEKQLVKHSVHFEEQEKPTLMQRVSKTQSMAQKYSYLTQNQEKDNSPVKPKKSGNFVPHLIPPWKQELLIKKRQRERLEGLPAWQRELILKKRVSTLKVGLEESCKMSGSSTTQPLLWSKTPVPQSTTSAPWSKAMLRATGSWK